MEVWLLRYEDTVIWLARLQYLKVEASRLDILLLIWFSSKLTKKLNNASIRLSEWDEQWAPKKVPASYRLITGEDDMWRCSCLGIVAPLFLRWMAQHSHSPWHTERKTEVIEEEGMILNAPLTPQNEIDRLTEVIAPSTIFFGRKYCYRQIGDSISGRR